MKNSKLSLRALRFAAVSAIMVFASVCVAHAQSSVLFQNATVTTSGNTINLTRVPVVISASVTVYVDLTLKFNADSNGNLTLVSGYPQSAPSATLLTSNFKAGTYVGPSVYLSGKGLITVSGPGVTDGGATIWTIATASGADNYTYPTSASWYVGPIANSPLAPRLAKAGITSTAWSYGTTGHSYNTCDNELIGLSQVGNTITIANFTGCQATDSNTPKNQLTFTLVQ